MPDAALAISAADYIASADDHTPSAAESDAIKAAVTTALDARNSTVVTPGAADALAPLTTEQLDQKYSASENRLRSLFSGPPLERELFALSNTRDAEQDLKFRYVGGGALTYSTGPV